MAVTLAPHLTQRSHSWTEWKAIAALKKLVMQHDEDDVAHSVWGYDGPEVHVCTVWKGDVPHGVVDGGYSQAQSDADLAELTSVLSSANQPVVPRLATGESVIAPTFLHASEQARLQGYVLECEPAETAILDVEVTTQMLVQGGGFWIENAKRGDKCHFSVVDKHDVVGLHTLYGYPDGTPIELVRYVKDYRTPTAVLWDDDIIMPTVAPVAPGLFLRATYEAVAGGDTRAMGVLFRWYIGS